MSWTQGQDANSDPRTILTADDGSVVAELFDDEIEELQVFLHSHLKAFVWRSAENGDHYWHVRRRRDEKILADGGESYRRRIDSDRALEVLFPGIEIEDLGVK